LEKIENEVALSIPTVAGQPDKLYRVDDYLSEMEVTRIIANNYSVVVKKQTD
jgi:hypothetical protein